MSIMANQSPRSGMPSAARTILFWVVLIAVAVVFWQIDAKSGVGGRPNSRLDLIAAAILVGGWVFTSLVLRKARRRPAPKEPENRPLG